MMTRLRQLAVSVVTLALILAACAPAAAPTSTATPFPTAPAGVQLSLPPSLDDLAAQYPELAGVLNDPELDSVCKEFVVAYHHGGLAEAREFAQQRGILNEHGEVRVTLVTDGPPNVPAVTEDALQLGLTVEGSHREEINLGIPLTLIEPAPGAGRPEALFADLTALEHVLRARFTQAALPARLLPESEDTLEEAVAKAGEGVALTGADKWHAAGFTGQGVRIGILDLGFDGYRRLLGDELPANIVVRSFIPGKAADETGTFHGAAVAKIIHDMAPDAELLFAAYDGTSVSMGLGIDWLVSEGVQIINHSAGNEFGPMDGSAHQAAMVTGAADLGVLWVNASGNQGDDHYRVGYTDADGDSLHEFPDGNEYMMVIPYAEEFQITLKWDDWKTVSEDYQLALYDANFAVAAASTNSQTGTPGEEPQELIWYEGSAPGQVYYLGIQAVRVTRPAVFDIFAYQAGLAFKDSAYSLNTPGDAVGSLTVGAAQWRDDSLSFYSSRGPTSDGRLKPELSAPAGVTNTLYPYGFEGTSAAAPHAAGAAALVWGAYPDMSREAVIAFLEQHALDLGEPGPDLGYGYGRLQLPDPAQLDLPLPRPRGFLESNWWLIVLAGVGGLALALGVGRWWLARAGGHGQR